SGGGDLPGGGRDRRGRRPPGHDRGAGGGDAGDGARDPGGHGRRVPAPHPLPQGGAAGAAVIEASMPSWSSAIPEARRRHLRWWLASGAGLTFLIVVIGGITRLTQSGLSIVDWDPIMGVIPPLNEAEWRE